MKRLLQGAVPGHRGVQHLVSKTPPNYTEYETYIRILRRSLVLVIQLAAIVQAQHNVILNAAPAFGDAESFQQPGAARKVGVRSAAGSVA
jgi:hypothetical protein